MTLIDTISQSIIRFFKRNASVVQLFILVKVVLLVFILFGKQLMPFSETDYLYNGDHYYTLANTTFENALAPYDGQLYLKLADRGYTGVIQEDTSKKIYAFFPLYPLLIYLFSFFTAGNLYLAGIFISFLASFIGVIYLYKLLRIDENETVSQNSVWYFLIFPAAIFFFAIYSEALFFMLSVMTFYFARKHRWWLAGILAYCSALTRSFGLLLLIPLCIEYYFYLKELRLPSMTKFWERTKGNVIVLCLPILGLLTYLFYAHLTVGDFFFPLHIQELWGRGSPQFWAIFTTLTHAIWNFFSLPIHSFKSSQLDTLFTVLFIGLLAVYWKKIRLSYAIYALFLILLPLSSGSTMSMIRYLAVSFPHFILLAHLGKKHSWVHHLIVLFFILLLGIFTIRFINWHWIG